MTVLRPERLASLDGLPGSDLVIRGLDDLAVGIVSEYSLLMQVAAPRLRRLGLEVRPLERSRPYEHQLYDLLEEGRGDSAYAYFNSLLARITSFSRCLEREASLKEGAV